MSEKFHVAERLFGKDNPYFSSFYIEFNHNELRSFFDNHEDERKYLTYFFFYIESLVCVKNLPHNPLESDSNVAGSLAHLHANELWYSTLLTILIGIIDKTISPKMDGIKCECCGKTKNKAQNSFKSMMSQLREDTKNYFTNYYKGGIYRAEGFTKVIEDIYSDRTFFAHDVANLKPPAKDGLVHEMIEKGILIKFNIKPEEIMLHIVWSLLKQWGYEGELLVATTKEHKRLSDFI